MLHGSKQQKMFRVDLGVDLGGAAASADRHLCYGLMDDPPTTAIILHWKRDQLT